MLTLLRVKNCAPMSIDIVLTAVIGIIVILSFVASYLKYSHSKKYIQRNKPTKATECSHCRVELTERNLIEKISCAHPKGMVLSELPVASQCVDTCMHATPISHDLDQDARIYGPKQYALIAFMQPIMCLVPSGIAIWRIYS